MEKLDLQVMHQKEMSGPVCVGPTGSFRGCIELDREKSVLLPGLLRITLSHFILHIQMTEPRHL